MIERLKKIWRTTKLVLLGVLLGVLLTAICLAPPLMRRLGAYTASAGPTAEQTETAETPETPAAVVLRLRLPAAAAAGAAVSADGLEWFTPRAGVAELTLAPGRYDLRAARGNRLAWLERGVYQDEADAAPVLLDLDRAPDCQELTILECNYGEGRAFALDIQGAEAVLSEKTLPGLAVLRVGGIFRLEAAANLAPGFYHTPLVARAADGEAVLHAGLRVRAAGPATLIATESDLRAVAYNLNGHFRLTEDIDLSAVAWQSLGNEEHPFTGVFDGGGHEIRGLIAPLFGVVRRAEISALILSAPAIDGGEAPAAAIALVARDSYIHDAAVLDGEVRAGAAAAGCVYRAEGSILSGLLNTAAVRAEAPAAERPLAGGIAALLTDRSLVRACVNAGPVSGAFLTGGIAARSTESDIARCFATGGLSGPTGPAWPAAAAIVPLTEWGRVADCYYTEDGTAPGAGNQGLAVVAAVTPVSAERALEAEALPRLGEFGGTTPEWVFRPDWPRGPLPAGIGALLPEAADEAAEVAEVADEAAVEAAEGLPEAPAASGGRQ
ncbi:MAG: hypothetical protein LBS10_07270 [Gracilibacteraceae bacterium]|jgi:hypothetical protein|nr:hypothetical protein [Gracilibacteraceae bacterium]